MATSIDKRQNFVTRLVSANNLLLVAMKELKEAKKEYDALNLGAEIQQSDLDNSAHGYMVAAEIGSAITSHAAIETFITEGFHYTNLYAMVP